MSHKLAPLVALALAVACSEPAPAPLALKVMSFNVMCSFCASAADEPWERRLEAFRDIFERHDPDLLGLQELFTVAEVEEIEARRPGFAAVWFHDDENRFLGDYPDAAIFYRTSMFDLLAQGFYWLSETPDEPWSRGWSDAQIWRLVAWTRLRHKPSGRELYFATTHFDNNTPNQDRSAPLLLRRTEPEAQRPVIVVGDFNSKPSTSAYATLVRGENGAGFALADAYDLAARRDVVHNQASAPDYDPAQRIDHLFVQGPGTWSVSRWYADLHVYGEAKRYPSDHFPVGVELSLP